MDNAIEKGTVAQYDKLIFEKSRTPSHLLCWGHYYEILKIDDELERNFYIRQQKHLDMLLEEAERNNHES